MDVRSGAGARPAVVCCHGLDESKDWGFFPALADRLARAGFAAVTFDYSGAAVGRESVADLGVVLDALARGDLGATPTNVGVMGHGFGGEVALLRAADDARIRAVVTWGSEPGGPARGNAPLLALSLARPWNGPTPEFNQALDATVEWFGRPLP